MMKSLRTNKGPLEKFRLKFLPTLEDIAVHKLEESTATLKNGMEEEKEGSQPGKKEKKQKKEDQGKEEPLTWRTKNGITGNGLKGSKHAP
jgi:hypothetical protein